MIDGFKERLEGFVKEWDELSHERFETAYPSLTYHNLEFKINRKWAKVFQENSVKAFVNTENGDIMKPASWKAPAKHPRGNIFSKTGGMEAISDSVTSCIRYMK